MKVDDKIKDKKIHKQVESVLDAIYVLVNDHTEVSWRDKLAAIRNLARSNKDLDPSLAEFVSWFDKEE